MKGHVTITQPFLAHVRAIFIHQSTFFFHNHAVQSNWDLVVYGFTVPVQSDMPALASPTLFLPRLTVVQRIAARKGGAEKSH